VNEAQIFRFLTKPCPPEQLKAAVEDGLMQHRLVTAERRILQETLIGCIQALMDVLAITNPVAFGRASHIKRLVTEFAGKLDCGTYWQLVAAAMLSQLGYVSLPVDLVQKHYYGERLTPEEQILVKAVPDVVNGLLQHIPRLEPVMQILTALTWKDEQLKRLGDGTIGLGARILGLVLQYDELVAQGHTVDVAVQTLRGHSSRYGDELIEGFAKHVGAGSGKSEARQIALRSVRPGMLIMQDIRTHLGTLLVPRGFEVTTAFIERMRNFGPELLGETVNVVIPAAGAESQRQVAQR
jgi:hypothetical protein